MKGINRIPNMTLSTFEIYREAIKIGFDVKIAVVWLKKNWDYDVEITNFSEEKFIIEKPRKYDNRAIS